MPLQVNGGLINQYRSILCFGMTLCYISLWYKSCMYIVGTKAIYRPMFKKLGSIYVNVIAMLLQIKV